MSSAEAVNDSASSSTAEDILSGGGEMGMLMRAMDWAATPLGPVESWPQSLRTSVSICLNSRFPILIWWGPQLVKLYNDAYSSLLGDKHPRALGAPGREIWPEIWDIIGPMLAGVLERGEATWSDDQMLPLRRKGYTEECYFTFSYSPISDESGIGGVFTAVTETTERVVSERRLATLRELAASRVEAQTAEAACATAAAVLAQNPADLPFALIYLLENDGSQAMLAGAAGLEPASVNGPTVVSLTTPAVQNGWPLAHAIDKGPILVRDLGERFGDLPGGPWPEPTHTALVLPIAQAGQDRMAGVLVAGVSPRRELDDHYRGFLDLVAGQLAKDIAEARAYEAERQRAEALAELDRAKTTFFSNVSHEFRTPLTLLLGLIEDGLSDAAQALGAVQRERQEVAHRNALRLLRLVNTLLDFSRLEAGRAQASYEPTDLSAYTAELASTFRSATERAGLRLTIDCPPLPEPIYVDREMWEKIVFNLLSNALKFTFDGEIRVSLRQVDDHVRLMVRDTGTGIAADELPRLFERFHRIQGVRARTHEGTGIGLALSQELARLHGGSIDVESTVGRGSTFTVTLPRGIGHLPADRIGVERPLTSTALGPTPYLDEIAGWLPSPDGSDAGRGAAVAGDGGDRGENLQPVALPNGDTRPDSERPRILVADDNRDMRDYVVRLLRPHYAVEGVADGERALQTARVRPPDLIVSDIMMPGLDGFGLVAALRADARTHGIPIILLSARAGEEERVAGILGGADDYLVKPFSAKELLARIEGRLELSRLHREAAERERALRAEAQAARDALEKVLSQLNDHYVVYDRDWRYVFVNDKAAAVLGRPKEQLVGACIWDLFPDAVGNDYYQAVHRALEEQRDLTVEFYYAPFDRWFENHIYAAPEGVSVLGTDITVRKHAEEAMRESEERFRNMADHAPVMLWVTDPVATCTYLNASWYEFTGQTPETALGLGWLDAVHPDDRQSSSATFLEANRDHRAFRLEYRLRRHDGTFRWAIDSASPRLGPDGAFLGYIGSVIDMHDRKQAEAERERLLAQNQRQRDFLERIVAGAPLAIAVLKGHDLEYVSVNPAYQAIMGPDVPFVGRTYRDVFPEAADRGAEDRLRDVLRTGQPWKVRDFETGIPGRPDPTWWEGECLPLRSEQGGFDSVLVLTWEITDRKRAEVERERLLAQEQAARAEAEAATRAQDEFLSIAAHELRNPVAGIKGTAQLLRRIQRAGRLDGERLDRYLASIETGSDRLTALTEDLLDVSRLQHGALPLRLNETNFAALVRDIVSRLPEQVRRRVRLSLTDTDRPMVVDSDRVEQIIVNLLDNAAKYAPEHEEIQVGLRWEADGLELRVRDQGIGLPIGASEQIFRPFGRASNAQAANIPGLGLGLYICRQIAQQHGGRLWAESDGEGQGTAFILWLPSEPPGTGESVDG